MDRFIEELQRRRMHGLYLSRKCLSLEKLSRELMGLHCWFHRNVAFSALIRGADIAGWKTSLTKTWLYRGTLHGVMYDELPLLLAPHTSDRPWAAWIGLPQEELVEVADEVIRFMEDGVYSRAELRRIYAERYDPEIVGRLFSPWGGIFVYLARNGRVSFRSMVSRDFDLIDAAPTLSAEEAMPELLRRYFTVYGPATLADATWFFGVDKALVRRVAKTCLDDFERIEHGAETYYYADAGYMGEIPHLTLLSGFDPYIVSYVDRSAALDPEYRSAVILTSGICLPSIAIDGKVAGLWNIKNNRPTVEFFKPQPRRIQDEALDLAAEICGRTAGQI